VRGASRTAQYVALFRALESVRPPGERLFEDPLARGCLDGRLGTLADLARVPGIGRVVPALVDRRSPGSRLAVVVRTRFIDDALRDALARGLDQVVLLGAGFDGRAHRVPEIERTRVFEVDHPDTQAAKRETVRRTVGEEPAHVAYVPVDFDRQDLAAELRRAGFETGARTFFVLEGVISYLTAAAVDATFRYVASAGGTGSEIAFTYLHQGVIDGSHRPMGSGQARARVMAAGEPWRFGFDPPELPGYLAPRGLELLEDVSPAEAAPRYVPAEHRRTAAFYRLARARPAGDSRQEP
jgi:methyltransferase (TIGR00027 family)